MNVFAWQSTPGVIFSGRRSTPAICSICASVALAELVHDGGRAGAGLERLELANHVVLGHARDLGTLDH
jgi:hypothetical protein